MRRNVTLYLQCLASYVNTATENPKSSGIVQILEGFIQAGDEVHCTLRPINLLA
jgi:hypothetical protein